MACRRPVHLVPRIARRHARIQRTAQGGDLGVEPVHADARIILRRTKQLLGALEPPPAVADGRSPRG
jgi:hypothetical protein